MPADASNLGHNIYLNNLLKIYITKPLSIELSKGKVTIVNFFMGSYFQELVLKSPVLCTNLHGLCVII